jgi:hypothetical protein
MTAGGRGNHESILPRTVGGIPARCRFFVLSFFLGDLYFSKTLALKFGLFGSGSLAAANRLPPIRRAGVTVARRHHPKRRFSHLGRETICFHGIGPELPTGEIKQSRVLRQGRRSDRAGLMGARVAQGPYDVARRA